jgi:hypothetical protein
MGGIVTLDNKPRFSSGFFTCRLSRFPKVSFSIVGSQAHDALRLPVERLAFNCSIRSLLPNERLSGSIRSCFYLLIWPDDL